MTLILKASGMKEEFSEEKLRASLQRSLAPPELIEQIVTHVKGELKEGMTTHEIYRHAFSLLKKSSSPVAGRYHLKKAIMELGPSGYLFEKFVGEIFKAKGFSVEVGKTVHGYCVDHEVDVIAEKLGKRLVIECKFHNSQGTKSDVKVALYVKARFDDIMHWEKQDQGFHEAWLVTNTKLTWDAIRYSKCVGLNAVGWSYPPEGSLQQLVEQSSRHPITCLTTLNKSQKRVLLNNDIILCRDLIGKKHLLKLVGMGHSNMSQITKEIAELCGV